LECLIFKVKTSALQQKNAWHPASFECLSSLTSCPKTSGFQPDVTTNLTSTARQIMANRLTQIATRTGDNGTTGLGDNTRVSKGSLRVHAMGDVDELNSCIGVLLCETMPDGVRTLLVEVQHQLFNLGGELSIPGYELLKSEAVALLDAALDEHNAALPRLAEFILPAGSRAASLAHVCRTVARRAERAVVALGVEEALKDAPRQYLNRLSDLLFVLSRVLNRMNGGDDVYWKSERMAKAAEN
jgi:cob(I)alamin adenosyltransferase